MEPLYHGFQGEGIPALFDEWAHPACYTYATLQEDPNIREFWGHSIERMWSGLFDAPGGLGGAIWGYVDETFMLPEPKVGTAFWKEFARTAKPEDYQVNASATESGGSSMSGAVRNRSSGLPRKPIRPSA